MSISALNGGSYPQRQPQRKIDTAKGEKFFNFADEISKMRFSQIKDSGKEFPVIDKETWNELIQSRDRQKIDNAYKNAFKELGASFNMTLDKKGGNGDGDLTFSEFKSSGLYDEANGDIALKKAFNNFDVNKDGKIDSDEMAAFLRLTDNSVNPNEKGGDNAKIDAYSLTARLMAMEKPEMKGNMNAAFKHLFE